MSPDPFRSLTERKSPTTTPAQQRAPEGTFEQEFSEELAKSKAFFRAADAARAKNLDFNGDGSFFTCVVFPSEAHRNAFLEAVKAVSFWDDDPQYIDGVQLAAQLGIPLPAVPQIPPPKPGHGWRGVPLIL